MEIESAGNSGALRGCLKNYLCFLFIHALFSPHLGVYEKSQILDETANKSNQRRSEKTKKGRKNRTAERGVQYGGVFDCKRIAKDILDEVEYKLGICWGSDRVAS